MPVPSPVHFKDWPYSLTGEIKVSDGSGRLGRNKIEFGCPDGTGTLSETPLAASPRSQSRLTNKSRLIDVLLQETHIYDIYR